MSLKRKIAIAYTFTIPVILATVFILQIALSGVSGSAGEMAQAAIVVEQTDTALAALKEAGANAQKYAASGHDLASRQAYESSITELRNALQEIDDETKDDRSMGLKFKVLVPLVEKQITIYEQTMAPSRKRAVPRGNVPPIVVDPNLIEEIEKMIVDIGTLQRARLQQQRDATGHNVRLASRLTTYGGGVVIWLVGVGAFLLFHDERTRAWKGIERRVHSNVLQSLPLGVTVATETGLIVYANPAEEAFMGFNHGELLGKNATILHDLEGKSGEPTVNAILERLNSDKVWTGELPVRNKDTSIKNIPSWVMNIAFPGKVYRVFIHQVN